MRRSLSIALGAMVLVLIVPSAALAHNGHEGHHHHGRHHHKFHARHGRFHVVHVGAGATSPPTPPATTPENAGTVTSYTNNVLTLTLNDGSTISGKVTSDTRIGCIAAAPVAPTTEEMGDHDFGDDRGGPGSDGSKGSWHGKGHDGDRKDPGASEPPCDSSSLVSGAIVRAAELRVGPSGSAFESIWLVK